MPLLEYRRQSRAVAARLQEGLTLRLPPEIPALPWSLSWGVLHLSGTALGPSVFHFIALPFSPEFLTRLSGGLIPLLALLGGRRTGWFWLGVLVLGLASGATEFRARQSRPTVLAPDPISPSVVAWREGVGVFRVTSWPASGRRETWKAAAVLLEWRDRETGAKEALPCAGHGVMLNGEGEAPMPGQILVGRSSLRVPSGGDLPGSFDYREFLAGRSLSWQGKLIQISARELDEGPLNTLVRKLESTRNWIRGSIHGLLPRREAELAVAVLLGARTTGSRQGAEPFADLGLAHLFAVSGLHVGILLGIMVLPGKALGLSSSGRIWPLLLFLPLYAALTGLPGSVVRAAGLALLTGAAGPLGRRGKSLHTLGLLFWGTTLVNPGQVLDTGVRLSYLAAGGIIAVMGLMKGHLGKVGRGSFLVTALSVSLAAQWFTLPQAANSFGRFSLLAPVANLLAVPLFGLGVWAVVLALVVWPVLPWLAQAIAAWGWLILRGLSAGVALVSRGTGGVNAGLAPSTPATVLVWGLLSLAGLIILPRISRRNGLALAGLALIILLGHGVYACNGYRLVGNGAMRVWQFDVGQGDCALVVFPDRWTCLVDVGGVFGRQGNHPDGPVNRSVIPFLARGWLNRLDAVVLGHGHLDHTGGTQSVDQELEIGHWWAGGDAADDVAALLPGSRVTTVKRTEILHRSGPWTLEILFPEGGIPEEFHENDRSLVLVLARNGRPCMVWSGDLETHGEKFMLERAAALPEGVQVWKAGHHGSNTSGSGPWLERLHPGLIIISCGVGNKYGHPNHGWYTVGQDTLDTVRTDLEGSVLLEWDAEGGLTWKSRARQGQLTALP